MIKNSEPISMAESLGYLGKEKKGIELKGFVNKFVKINLKDAKELKDKLEEFKSMKIKRYHISKIIDLMPENEDELNKIFPDVSLDEDETKKILETIKEYK